MVAVLEQISPLFCLLLFGVWLQRIDYFEEVAYARLQHFVFNIAIPCMLFGAMFHLELDAERVGLSISFFVLMVLLMAAGFVLKAVFRVKRRFFPFLFASFGFGTIGLPFFSTIFDPENAAYMSVFGVGHELFVALLFLPFAQVYLSGEKFDAVRCAKTLLRSPSMILPVSALLLRGLGFDWLLTGNFVGQGLLGAISQLGGLTLTIMLVLLGYRVRFSDRKILMACLGYALVREAVTLVVCGVYFALVLLPMTGGEVLYRHAYVILVLQHLSIALTIFVARFSPREDAEIINGTFVLNVLFGFSLSALYLLLFTA